MIGRDLLVKQLGWMVGTGEEINVWDDPWLSHCEQVRPMGPAPEALQSLKVSGLLLIQSEAHTAEAPTNQVAAPDWLANVWNVKNFI